MSISEGDFRTFLHVLLPLHPPFSLPWWMRTHSNLSHYVFQSTWDVWRQELRRFGGYPPTRAMGNYERNTQWKGCSEYTAHWIWQDLYICGDFPVSLKAWAKLGRKSIVVVVPYIAILETYREHLAKFAANGFPLLFGDRPTNVNNHLKKKGGSLGTIPHWRRSHSSSWPPCNLE